MERSQNVNISELQSMLCKVLQSKQHESKQEVNDARERMKDLMKALLEESHMMHERKILKR